MFNLAGTFTTAQFEELRKYAKIQEQDLKARLQWLTIELENVGKFNTEYDSKTNYPISFSATPGSYASKLLTAYKILGGVPERDMLLRTSDKPVFLTRAGKVGDKPGDSTGGYSDIYSNGRRYRGNMRFDRDMALKIERFKKWQLETIKQKREHLEFKIKRALDHSDQLQIEIDIITAMLDPNSSTTVDNQILKIKQFMFKKGVTSVVENIADLWGLDIGKIGDASIPDELDRKDAEALRGLDGK